MKRSVLSALILFALWLCPQPRAAAADPLTLIPDAAFVVVRFDSLEKTLGNFKDMLDGIGPAAAPAADGLAQGIGDMLEFHGNARGKVAEVLDGGGAIHVALFPMFDARRPPTAIFVKVKDEAKLRRALFGLDLDDADAKIEVKKRDDGFTELSREGTERKWYLIKRDEFTVYTGFAEIVKNLIEKDAKSMADVLDARGLRLVRGGDMSLAVNVAPVVEKHKDDIEAAREKIGDYIKALPDAQLGTSPEATKKIYTDLVRFAFNGLHDVSWFAGSTSFSSQGAKAEGLVGVKRYSLTDWVLLANPPAALENLDVLPTGAAAYYGLNINPSLMSGMMAESLKMSYGTAIRDKEAAAKAAEGIVEAKAGSSVASFSFPGEEKTGMKTVSITQAAFPRKLTEATSLLMRAFGEQENPLFTMSMEYKPTAEKYKQHEIDTLTVKFKAKNTEAIEGQLVEAMFKKLFGPDGLQERITTLDKLVIQVAGNDPKQLERVLDGIADSKDIAGLDKAFGKTRDALGKDSNLLVMVNAPQMLLEVVAMLKDIPLLGDGLKMLPFNFSLKPPTSFGGVSLGSEAQGLRLRAFVPVEQPKAILQIFAPGT